MTCSVTQAVLFTDVAGGEAFDHLRSSIVVGADPLVAVPDKQLSHGDVGDALVAVDERVIPDDARAEDRRLDSGVGVKVGVPKPGKRGSESRLCRVQVDHFGKPLGVDVEDRLGDQEEVGDRQPVDAIMLP